MQKKIYFNQAGFGLVGFLIAALLAGILAAAVLKPYLSRTVESAQMLRQLSPAGVQKNPSSVHTKTETALQGQPTDQELTHTPKPPACNGRQVGKMCIPTQAATSLGEIDKYQ